MDRPIVAKHDMKDWLFYTFWKCARRLIVFRGKKGGRARTDARGTGGRARTAVARGYVEHQLTTRTLKSTYCMLAK
jgi:hypothetical protein